MRKYTNDDLEYLAAENGTVTSYGIPVIYKRSPAGIEEGILDPWVKDSIVPLNFTHEDGALKTDSKEFFAGLREKFTDDQILMYLQALSESKIGPLPVHGPGFQEGFFKKPIRTKWTSFEQDNTKIRFWSYEVPDDRTGKNAYINIHGGGWFAGHSHDSNDQLRYISENADAVVFDIEYSLSPQVRFPVAVEECYAALKHIYYHADEYGIDASRIAVGGGSAGGNLTAALTLMAKDENIPMISLQVLQVPAVLLKASGYKDYAFDDADFNVAPETEQFFTKPVDLEQDPNGQIMIKGYLGDPGKADDHRASPMLAGDFGGLPPALVITAEFDQIRPQGEYYASLLSRAGVPVRVIRYQGQLHDSNGKFGTIPQTEDMLREIVRAMKSGMQ